MGQSIDQINQDISAPQLTSSPFFAALQRALRRRKLSLENICDVNDPTARRLLIEYGAMFLAEESVLVPPVCVFRNAEEVELFQQAARPKAMPLGDAIIELQPRALLALVGARRDAVLAGYDLTPRDGAEAARRGYDDTVRLWASRVEPALEHWLAAGRLTLDEATRVRALAPTDQTAAVLALEARGLWCSKDFSKSILYSVAAPGASQHLALIAFDVAEFTNASVRAILARHGWFQTVRSDRPHFTFLGLREAALPDAGLKRIVEDKQIFWLPAVG